MMRAHLFFARKTTEEILGEVEERELGPLVDEIESFILRVESKYPIQFPWEVGAAYYSDLFEEIFAAIDRIVDYVRNNWGVPISYFVAVANIQNDMELEDALKMLISTMEEMGYDVYVDEESGEIMIKR